jgi:hypothetical protein
MGNACKDRARGTGTAQFLSTPDNMAVARDAADGLADIRSTSRRRRASRN